MWAMHRQQLAAPATREEAKRKQRWTSNTVRYTAITVQRAMQCRTTNTQDTREQDTQSLSVR